MKFSLATSYYYKDKSGERQQKTEWHNVDFWGASGETIAKHFHKGDGIVVEGSITYNEFTTKEGAKSTFTSIRGDRWEFPVGKANTDSAPATHAAPKAKEESYADDMPF